MKKISLQWLFCLLLAVPLSGFAQLSETEPNNTWTQPDLVPELTSMSGVQGNCATIDGSADWFRLDVTNQGKLKLNTSMTNTGVNSSVSMTIRNSNISILQSFSLNTGTSGLSVDDSLTMLCVGPGIYYLEIIGTGGNGCLDYTFSYEVAQPVYENDAENNNAWTVADTVAQDSLAQGRMDFIYGNNIDWYRLVLNDDGIMNLHFDAEHAGASTTDSVTVRLRYNSTAIFQTWRIPIGANSTPVHTDIALADCLGNENLYYIDFASDACGTSYQFSYDVTNPVYADDIESNDSWTIADTVIVDSVAQGRLNFNYDDNSDWYRLVLDDDGVINLHFDAEHTGANMTDSVTVRLRYSSTTIFQTWRIPVGANSNPVHTDIALADCLGNENLYYIDFASDACGTSYQFSYDVTNPVFADDTESNDSWTIADTVMVDSVAQGRLNFNYDDNSDWYRLVMDDDGSLNFTIEAEHTSTSTTDSLTIRLRYNTTTAFRTWRAAIGAGSIPVSSSFTETCLGNENLYYIDIASDACGTSYRFSYDVDGPVHADDVENNDNWTIATDIDLDMAEVQGRLNFTYDDNVDYYRVILPADGMITINSLAENSGVAGSYDVDILNSSISQIETHNLPVGAASLPVGGTFTTAILTAGTYYLRVENAPCGTSYMFECNDDDNDGTCNFFDLCPSGPEPGTPCDDLDACTAGDIILADCSCAGTFQDSDNDGTCDANDVCPGGPEPGTLCDDLDANTGNDVIQADCSCAGQLIDCEGVAGGTDLPGQPCDDGDPNTGGDVYQADCTCAGSAVDCNGVAGGPDVPGAPCDDGDATTGMDVYQTDCSCAGMLIDCEGVAGGTDLPGQPCDDGDPNTGGDVYQADCTCTGSAVDCNGIAGGPDVPGAPCDDGNATTGNDVYQADCSCAGQLIDCEGVAGGTDLPGQPCDDGDANTTGDTYQADCTCTGTPVGSGTNNLSLIIDTDNNGSETSWEILPAGSSSPVCSGSGYPSNMTSIEFCNVPDGCYELRVFDSMGDGMFTGAIGGYLLNDQFGNAIIDNTQDGQFASTSAIINNGAFCVPIGNDQLTFQFCGKIDLLPADFIVAENNPAVAAQFGTGDQSDDGFQFWFFDPDGSYQRRIFKSHANPSIGAPPGVYAVNHLNLSSMASLPLPLNIKLNCRIRSRVNGVNSEFGPACVIAIDPSAAACPMTKLVDDPSSAFFSCGVAKSFGGSEKVRAIPVPGANKYQYRFENSSEGYLRNIARPSYVCPLNWGTLPLSIGVTYQVSVRMSYDNGSNWCPWGDACDVTIVPDMANFGGRSIDQETASEFQVFPNPYRGGMLNMSINADTETSAQMSILDLTGKLVHNQQINLVEGQQNVAIDLNERLAKGSYLIKVEAGDLSSSQRLIVN